MSGPSPPPSASPAVEDTSFEATMKRLAEIVTRLERGDLPLEESLTLFEEGVRLSARSQEKLDGAQRRVEELLAVDANGRTKKVPFDLRED